MKQWEHKDNINIIASIEATFYDFFGGQRRTREALLQIIWTGMARRVGGEIGNGAHWVQQWPPQLLKFFVTRWVVSTKLGFKNIIIISTGQIIALLGGPPIDFCIKLLTSSEKMKKPAHQPLDPHPPPPSSSKITHQSPIHPAPPKQTKNTKTTPSAEPHPDRDQVSAEINDLTRNHTNLNSHDSDHLSALPRSPYHNFQKHAVVLIKKLALKLPAFLRNSPAELLARQMWSIFQTSGLKSKKIIIILFGQADFAREKYLQLLIECYFGELCHEREQVVREAQSILRTHALALLQESRAIAYIRRNRHIRCKYAFLAYFRELLSQLREGPLKRFRLSSASSRKILENLATASSLDEPVKSGRK